MKYHDSMEMYLETIYLLEQENGHAHVAEISKALKISMPSVTKAMEQLRKRFLINKEEYGTVTLTEEGRDASKRIFEKHVLITEYLQKALGLTLSDAQENACRLEHVVTDSLLDAMKRQLDKEP